MQRVASSGVAHLIGLSLDRLVISLNALYVPIIILGLAAARARLFSI